MSAQLIAIERAVALLNAAKADFKIIAQDGSEFGNLIGAKRPGKKTYTRPRGTMLSHFKPFIENMQPGDTVNVPADFYDVEEVRGPISSWCSANWGAGNAITSIDRKNNVVEVLRVA